ncbi:MAG: hypothetical protein JST94_09275 [Bacteroidetes bacterium]|nr:hypothetical protein [Bacteroidota bacterium]MBS1671623.1 hypothetical protein [Bacteroidota bacterium]
MKKFLLLSVVSFFVGLNATNAQVDQVNTSGRNASVGGRTQNGMADAMNERVYGSYFEAKYMPKPPIYPYGQDSLHRYFYSHFEGFEQVLTKAIDKGDTAKYIRVYFQYVIDKNGTPFDGKFLRVAGTSYAKGDNAKTIKYFNEDKETLNKQVKSLVSKMGFWKPGLHNNVPVDAIVEDYFQFWVGINPPAH